MTRTGSITRTARNTKRATPSRRAKRTARARPATIAEMVEQWKALDRVGSDLANKRHLNDHDDLRLCSNVEMQTEIACRILATPARTPDDTAAKRQFIRTSGCLSWTTQEELVETIFKLDAERIGAAKVGRRSRRAGGTEAPVVTA